MQNREAWRKTGGKNLPKRPSSPMVPQGVEKVMDNLGQLLSIEAWFFDKVYSSRHFNPKKKYSKNEQPYVQYLIRDPGTQKMRLKTLGEFVHIVRPMAEFRGPPTDKNFSFMVWHKKFDPAKMRKLLPYYAPKLHDLIQNILRIEKELKHRVGHGTKHTVFTFSVSQSKPAKFRNYGSRIVLSAFAAYPKIFEVMVQYGRDPKHGNLRHLVDNNRQKKTRCRNHELRPYQV